MPKFIFVQGPPASGKSTWAQEWQLENPINRVIISRDGLRHMRGKYWVPEQESFIFLAALAIADEAMLAEYDICLDETNLNPGTLQKWQLMAERYGYETEYIRFEIPLKTCIERDNLRETHKVGEEVIRNFFERYNIDKNTGKINEDSCNRGHTW